MQLPGEKAKFGFEIMLEDENKLPERVMDKLLLEYKRYMELSRKRGDLLWRHHLKPDPKTKEDPKIYWNKKRIE